MPVRTGEPSDAAFIVEMARLASVIEDRPLPPADEPDIVQMLPPSASTSVLALDRDGHPVGAAWWHFPDSALVVTPDGAAVPELVVAVLPDERGRGVGRSLLDALTIRAAEHGYDRLALNVHIRNPPPGSTAAPASWSRGRAADRSVSPWSPVHREPDDGSIAPNFEAMDHRFVPVVHRSDVQAWERGPPVSSPGRPALERRRRRRR